MIHHKVTIQEQEKNHGFGPAIFGGGIDLLRDGRKTKKQPGRGKTWLSLCSGSQEMGA